jgi:hypothetical protein
MSAAGANAAITSFPLQKAGKGGFFYEKSGKKQT